MRRFLAITISKIFIFFGSIFNRGSSLPGYIALKIYPDIGNSLNTKNILKIAVTGANGKSSTTYLIYKILVEQGYKVSANLSGSNMRPGVLTSILKHTSLFGKVNVDIILMEVDEFSSIKVYSSFKPDYLVVTNILRDHIERQSDIINVLDKINNKLDNDTIIILNSDDPLSQNIMKGGTNNKYYYGIEDTLLCRQIDDDSSLAGKFCLSCGKKLVYDCYFYEHLGKYRCKKCCFKRPVPNIFSSKINLDKFYMEVNNKVIFNIPYNALYMYYNFLAAITISLCLKVPVETIKKIISDFSIGNARLEKFHIGNRTGVMNFLKNCTSLSSTCDLICKDPNNKTLVFFMDNTYDGKYFITQWYWDNSLSKIVKDKTIKHIICTWKRAYDFAVRLKCAGFDEKIIIVEPNIEKALEVLKNKTTGNIYLGYDTDSYNIKKIRKLLIS